MSQWRTDYIMINILLVDDHAVVRAGYRMLLQNSEEINIVAEVETGEQACKAFVDYNPDVVVMDLSMPGMGGLEALRRICARDAKAKVLVFSMHENTVFVDQTLNAGAKGYITKSSAPDVLINAIKA
ncbi:MAG: two-component system invasion response regulator UvrY, partial [Gammaproteobacteria bacterium]